MNREHVYEGSCHCSNIIVTLHSDKMQNELAPRECACSFCQRHKGKYISDPKGILEINVKDQSLLNRYQFGHKTADFLICKNCGVFMAAVCEINSNIHAVLNIRTMPDYKFSGQSMTNDYDAEDKMDRLERRAKNWIGEVRIS